MENTFVFPRKLLKKIINMYKKLPCLWDRTNITYKHKQKRHEAISKLTELVQEYEPAVTRVHVLRKIESLRACVRREHKRVIDSRMKANDPDEIYTPHLWYYELFSFLFTNEEQGFKKIRRGDFTEQNTDSPEEDVQTDEDVHPFEQSMESYPVDYDDVTSNMIKVADSSMSKRYQNYDEDKSKRHCTEIEDEYDAIGINVAAKLRSLPQNMRILSEKLINDVLYQAQMDGLNASTVITTPDPFKQDNIYIKSDD